MHGESALGVRDAEEGIGSVVKSISSKSEADLEYMKYVIIFKNGSISSVIDLDRVAQVRPPIGMSLRRALLETKMVPLMGADGTAITLPADEEPAPLKHCASIHEGAVPHTQSTLKFDTISHGVVKLKFGRFSDPDIRNSVSISVSRNLSRKTAWGAFVSAPSNPKKLRLKHMDKLPKSLTASEAEKINDYSNYYKVADMSAEYDGKAFKNKMLVKK